MMKKTLLPFATALACSSLAMTAMGMSKTPPPAPVDETVVYPPAETVVRFIAIGDSGTGKDGQYKVADAMQAVCEQRGCEFAIGLGDNIYESGVDGVHDIQFDTKFEDPYKNINFPFYMALGNHDNSWIIGGDGADNDKGEIQVEYHYRTDRKSEKWQMPARYYQFGAPLNTEVPLVEFFAMDTNPSASAGDPSDEYNKDDYSATQGKWLKDGFKASKAPWKIAFGHHPYISNGSHGNAGNYDSLVGQGKYFKAMTEENICGNADAMIVGHTHALQWLKEKESCPGTFHIVSGAGAKTKNFVTKINLNESYWQQDEILGFFYIEIQGDEFRGTAYTVDPVSGEHKAAYTRTMLRNK